MAIEDFQCARHYYVSIIGPTMVVLREKFSKLILSEGFKTLF